MISKETLDEGCRLIVLADNFNCHQGNLSHEAASSWLRRNSQALLSMAKRTKGAEAQAKAYREEVEQLRAEVAFLRKLEPCEVCEGTEVMCSQCHNPMKDR